MPSVGSRRGAGCVGGRRAASPARRPAAPAATAAAPLREVAGLTGSELFLANVMRKKTPAPPRRRRRGGGRGVARAGRGRGDGDAARGAAAPRPRRARAPRLARPQRSARCPPRRAHRAADDAAPAPAAPPIVSNAPRPMFDGAAGMNSGGVRRAAPTPSSAATRRPSTRRASSRGRAPSPQHSAPRRRSPRRRPCRASRWGASPGRAAWGGAGATASTLNHAANAVPTARPQAVAVRAAAAAVWRRGRPPLRRAEVIGDVQAGQRVGAPPMVRTAPKAPKEALAPPSPAAPASRRDLSRAANVELKFDGAPAARRRVRRSARASASPCRRRRRRTLAEAAATARRGSRRAEALRDRRRRRPAVDGASPASCGGGGAPRVGGARAERGGEWPRAGQATGAAGLTSSKMAQMAISEMSAEQRKLSLLAAHAALARRALAGGRRRSRAPTPPSTGRRASSSRSAARR